MKELTNLKVDMAEMQTDIKYIKESIVKIEDFIKESPKMFASKLTEVIVYTLCGVVLLGFIGILVKIVMPQQTLTASEVQKIVNEGIDNNNKKIFTNPELIK